MAFWEIVTAYLVLAAVILWTCAYARRRSVAGFLAVTVFYALWHARQEGIAVGLGEITIAGMVYVALAPVILGIENLISGATAKRS